MVASEGAATKLQAARPAVQPGEHELVALAHAMSARCCLLKQDYQQVAAFSHRFCGIYEGVKESGGLERLFEQERQVLLAHAVPQPGEPGGHASFLGSLAAVGMAAGIAHSCRERVGQGFAPAAVAAQTHQALEGLEP